MIQDEVFRTREGDAWFRRNAGAITSRTEHDWPTALLERVASGRPVRSILELGCANGWRLAALQAARGMGCRCVGVDVSEAAVADGSRRYPGLELHRGAISAVPLDEVFDVVVVHFVLHWVDRSTLARSVAEVDRMVADGGHLILGDFLPDYPQRRPYHHCPGEGVYTYKQDYASIFASLGTYHELARETFDHDRPGTSPSACSSGSRAFCALLHKSLAGGYPLA